MATGKQLRDARKKMNLSAERVAEKVGVSVNTIYAWESDSSKPRDEKQAKKLHDLLGIHVDTNGKKIPGSNVKAPPAKGPSVRKAPALTAVTERRTALVALFRLVGFFMSEPHNRSNVIELLELAKTHDMTVEDLLAIIKSHG